nr:helix-turn-helix domain-containing protein [Treponema sp.]
MRSWISGLKKIYNRSSIIQFLFSYLLVLSVPLILALVGEFFAASVVKNDIRSSNLRMLRYTSDLIDGNLDSIYLSMTKLSNDPVLLSLASQTRVSVEYILDARNLIENVLSSSTKQVSLGESLYVSFFSPEYVVANAALYHVDSYRSYMKERGLSEIQWKKMCRNDMNGGSRKPFFFSAALGKIQYVVPFSTTLDGANQGAVVCNIKEDALSHLLDFSTEYEKYSMFLFDENGKQLWKNDTLECEKSFRKMNLPNGEESEFGGSFFFDSYTAIYTKSERYGWKYVLVLPHRSALKKLYHLRAVLIFLTVIATALGLLISWRLSVRNGRPLNGIFALWCETNPSYAESEPLSPSVQNLLRLFEDMAARSTKKELFYPDLLEDSLILNLKSGNEQDVQAIISLIQEENENNRTLGDDSFALLHGNMIATLSSTMDSSLIPGDLLIVPDRLSRSNFFSSYRSFCGKFCHDVRERKSSGRKTLAEKMKKMVDSEYADSSLGLTKVAEAFSVSENYVSVVFKEQVGENFQSYLENVRLGHACLLLKETNYSVDEIAEKSGYYTVQSFRRAFKRVKGTTPTEYRK